MDHMAIGIYPIVVGPIAIGYIPSHCDPPKLRWPKLPKHGIFNLPARHAPRRALHMSAIAVELVRRVVAHGSGPLWPHEQVVGTINQRND